MNLPFKPLLLAAGVIALGVGVGVWSRGTSVPGAAAPLPVVASASEISADPPQANGAQSFAPTERLPWENPTIDSPSTGAAPARQLSTVMDSLAPTNPAQLQAQLRNNDKALDQALTQLNELESSGKLPPEIDAAALRSNLGIAKRAQQLAAEMLLLSEQPATESRAGRIEAIVAELRTLQAKVRTDVTRPRVGSAP